MEYIGVNSNKPTQSTIDLWLICFSSFSLKKRTLLILGLAFFNQAVIAMKLLLEGNSKAKYYIVNKSTLNTLVSSKII